MLEDHYKTISVYRETGDDSYNSFLDGEWVLKGTIEGFIQTAGGDYNQANQANIPTSTHTLYTDIAVDIEEDDRLLYNTRYYQVAHIQPDDGISGMMDHQEIDLLYLKDI